MDEDTRVNRIVPAHDTLMQIRLRNPYYWDAAGLLVVPELWLDWSSVEFLPADQCDHKDGACNNCLGDWFAEHEIMLTDTATGNTVNLDHVWETERVEQGYQPTRLFDYARSLESPGST